MKAILQVATLAFFLSSCAAPQPVSRLNPLQEPVYWSYGAKFVQLPAQEDLQMEVAFIRSTAQHLLFEVTLQNRSNQTFLVTPEVFRLQPLGIDRRPLPVAALPAADPEQILLELDKQESKQVAEDANQATIAMLNSALNIVEDISSTSKSVDAEERALRMQERQEDDAYYANREYENEMELISISEQRSYWANNTIRRTHLKPGFEMTGLVFFPRYNDASLLEARFPVEHLEFSVPYRQVLHYPNNRD